MKLSDDWKNDLIQTIENNALPVQVARVLRETLQVAGYSLDDIKAIVEDLQDEIEWLEIAAKK
jgi:hypothetical protein